MSIDKVDFESMVRKGEPGISLGWERLFEQENVGYYACHKRQTNGKVQTYPGYYHRPQKLDPLQPLLAEN